MLEAGNIPISDAQKASCMCFPYAPWYIISLIRASLVTKQQKLYYTKNEPVKTLSE